jgi:hypothetical protein
VGPDARLAKETALLVFYFSRENRELLLAKIFRQKNLFKRGFFNQSKFEFKFISSPASVCSR